MFLAVFVALVASFIAIFVVLGVPKYVLFSTLNDAPFFTLNGAVLAYKSKDSSFYL